MRHGRRHATALFALVALASCTAPKPAAHLEPTKPNRVLVRDFAVDPAQVQIDPVSLRGNTSAGDADAYRREDADSAQETLAATLVYRLQALGVPSQRASTAGPPQPGDMLLDGRVERIDEGQQETRTAAGAGRAVVAAQARLIVPVPNEAPIDVAAFAASSEEGGTPGLAAGAAASAIALRSGGVRARELLRASVSAEARRLGNVLAERVQGFFAQKGWLGPSG